MVIKKRSDDCRGQGVKTEKLLIENLREEKVSCKNYLKIFL